MVSVGRIVLFKIDESTVRPAIVVEAHENGRADLHVFLNGSMDAGKRFAAVVQFNVSEGDDVMQWSWPKQSDPALLSSVPALDVAEAPAAEMKKSKKK